MKALIKYLNSYTWTSRVLWYIEMKMIDDRVNINIKIVRRLFKSKLGTVDRQWHEH